MVSGQNHSCVADVMTEGGANRCPMLSNHESRRIRQYLLHPLTDQIDNDAGGNVWEDRDIVNNQPLFASHITMVSELNVT